MSGAAKARRGHFPSQALAKFVRFDGEMMHVALTDGRIISVPLIWFPALRSWTTAAGRPASLRAARVSRCIIG
jgi:hypothetical protein